MPTRERTQAPPIAASRQRLFLRVGALAAMLLLGVAPSLAETAPDPEPVEIETADGVLLSGTFYQAAEAGRGTPVVVMLADEDEAPSVFDSLASGLASPAEGSDRTPISVLAVALRGQGDSTRVRGADGQVTDLRGARLKPADAAAMVGKDMEAVRRYLVAKNDAGQLNLNRLAYLGVGLGAIVATNAAAVDWAVPKLSQSKQGRDVKGLVLVSAPWKQLGLEMLPALRQPGVRTEVAALVTYGTGDRRVTGDAERILRQLRQERPEAQEDQEGDTSAPETVVDAPADSRLQGSDLLKQATRLGDTQVEDFFQRTLAEPDHPWSQRRLD